MSGAFIYALAIGVCLGAALSILVGWGNLAALLCIVLGTLALLLARRFSQLVLVAVLCAAMALGFLRADSLQESQRAESLSSFENREVVVRGSVVEDPDIRATSVRAVLRVSSVDETPARGVVLAVLPRVVTVAYGETLEVQGVLTPPEAFLTDSGRVFDYPHYLEAQGVTSLLPRATLLSSTPGSPSVLGTLYRVKHTFMQTLERTLQEPYAALAGGLLLGERRALPPTLTDDFINAGLIHVVVLSGYNISLVSEGIFRALAFLPRTASFSIGAVSMFLFALMAGGGAATVRACSMALIALLARYFHRQALAVRMLALTCAGMVLWNPLSLLYDPSFILSVLATFGLIMLSPSVEEKLPKILAALPSLRSIVASTIAVQIFVLPALLYYTGILSFVAVPANVLALPVVPFAMLLGFVSGLLGLISPYLALAPAVLGQALLWWIISVASVSAHLPLATLTTPAFSAWLMVVSYIPLTAVAIMLYKKTFRKNETTDSKKNVSPLLPS